MSDTNSFPSKDGQYGYIKDTTQNRWRKIRLATGEEVGYLDIPQGAKMTHGHVAKTYKAPDYLPPYHKGKSAETDAVIDAYSGGLNYCKHDGSKVVWEQDGKEFYCAGWGHVDPTKYDIVLDLADQMRSPLGGKWNPDVIRTWSPKPYMDLNGYRRDGAGALVYTPEKPFVAAPRLANVVSFKWPDGGVLPMADDFWEELWELLPGAPGKPGKTLIACLGSHGRTGTCLAALMMASGAEAISSPQVAVLTVRAHHCEMAVESTRQLAYLNGLAKAWELPQDAFEVNRLVYGTSGKRLKELQLAEEAVG